MAPARRSPACAAPLQPLWHPYSPPCSCTRTLALLRFHRAGLRFLLLVPSLPLWPCAGLRTAATFPGVDLVSLFCSFSSSHSRSISQPPHPRHVRLVPPAVVLLLERHKLTSLVTPRSTAANPSQRPLVRLPSPCANCTCSVRPPLLSLARPVEQELSLVRPQTTGCPRLRSTESPAKSAEVQVSIQQDERGDGAQSWSESERCDLEREIVRPARSAAAPYRRADSLSRPSCSQVDAWGKETW